MEVMVMKLQNSLIFDMIFLVFHRYDINNFVSVLLTGGYRRGVTPFGPQSPGITGAFGLYTGTLDIIATI